VIATGSSLTTFTLKIQTSNKPVCETVSNFTTQDPPVKSQFRFHWTLDKSKVVRKLLWRTNEKKNCEN
jgi:hypothetical protein